MGRRRSRLWQLSLPVDEQQALKTEGSAEGTDFVHRNMVTCSYVRWWLIGAVTVRPPAFTVTDGGARARLPRGPAASCDTVDGDFGV